MEQYKQAMIAVVMAGLIAIIAMFFNSLKKIANSLFKKLEKKLGGSAPIDLLITLADFHQTIELIRDKEFVDRVLMFEATNCGGPPDPIKPYTIFCFYGWSTNHKHPELLYAHKIVIDSHYMRLLIELLEKGEVNVKTKELPDKSLLKSYLTQENAICANFYLLKATTDRITYLSVANYEREYTPPELTELSLIVARLKHVIKESD